MKNSTKITLIIVFFSLILSCGLAMFFPSNISKSSLSYKINLSTEEAVITQKVQAMTFESQTITRVYYKGALIGVLQDASIIDEQIAYKQSLLNQEEQEGGFTIRLDHDVYMITDNTFWRYENKDNDILNYLIDKDLFVVDAVHIDIYNTDGEIKDTIYVKNESDFLASLEKLVKCFVDEDTYNKLLNGETIPTIADYGSQDIDVSLLETIKSTETGTNVDNVFKTQQEIFDYLCYGRQYELKYYTIEEYDTIDGVAYKNGLDTFILMALNSQLEREDQVLVVGEQLNVTGFNCPITVITLKEALTKEIVAPGEDEYIIDTSLKAGDFIVEVAPESGYNNVLNKEIYYNGEPKSYTTVSTTVGKEAIAGVYRVGSGTSSHASKSFILPCKNCMISCSFLCYKNHTGVDFINIYNRYGDIYCVCSGMIITRNYGQMAGNFYRVDCGTDANGDHIVMLYMHMNKPGYFPPGTKITQGMIIGQIGNTGNSTGPHIHISIYVNGVLTNPCVYLPCTSVRTRY